jgi:hypothetical protein
MTSSEQWAQQLAECMEPWRVQQFPFFELVSTPSCENALPWTMRWQSAGGALTNGRMLAPKAHRIWSELGLPHDDVEVVEVAP